MNISFEASRRDLFKAAGGGVVIFFGAGMFREALAQRRPYPSDFHAYLSIGENGRVTVFSGKIEMGQGVLTSQAQMAAEELGVALASIEMVLGDTDRCPWDMGTFGSLTSRMFGPYLRAACAKAKGVMIGLAAKRLGVDAKSLEVKNGVVSVTGQPGKSVSYAALAKDARVAQALDEKAVLRDPAAFTVMGTSPKRLDGIEKVTGRARYAGDLRLPGMMYARILRPPVHGAKLTHLDTSAAEALPGVRVIKDGDLIAVLAADPERASMALGKIYADWQRPPSTLNPDTIFDHLVDAAKDVQTLDDKGDVSGKGAAQRFESLYKKGYVAHAAIEPHTAAAALKDGRMTVWASTQTPFPVREAVAKAIGFDEKNVRVITPFLGGGFGGKGNGPQAIEAARLAKASGVPVMVAWTRAEEFFFDTFDPAAVASIKSGLDAKGRISHWDYVIYSAGGRAAKLLYDIPNRRVRSAGGMVFEGDTSKAGMHLFGTGPWRAPGANMNVFVIESEIERLAAAAGSDPLEFRLAHLTDTRARRVLKAAAEGFGWKPAKGPSKRGVGIALCADAGSYTASIAQVSVDRASGEIKVERIVNAIDMGVVINPDGARMQCEGGVTMGLGYTLAEELRFQGGDILDRNFDTYTLPRFSWVPKIEVVLVKNDALAPQGCGEPSITTVGGAVANAVFDATGVRMTRLPLTRERVLAALADKNKA